MKVQLLFFAAHKRTAGISETQIEILNGSNARDLSILVATQFGLELQGSMVAVNEEYAHPDHILQPGDIIAFIPPVAGGSAHDNISQDYFLVTPDALDLLYLHAQLMKPEWGGQAVFTGSTRSPNQGFDITHLEYEAYPAMCVLEMERIVLEARARWDLGRVVIAHRTGVVLPAQLSIFIGVASKHRASCLEAIAWLLDEAKSRLPIWKLEVSASGQRWVEGAIRWPTI